MHADPYTNAAIAYLNRYARHDAMRAAIVPEMGEALMASEEFRASVDATIAWAHSNPNWEKSVQRQGVADHE